MRICSLHYSVIALTIIYLVLYAAEATLHGHGQSAHLLRKPGNVMATPAVGTEVSLGGRAVVPVFM